MTISGFVKGSCLTLLGAFAISGCADRTLTPYIGRWTGGFDVQRVTRKLTVDSPKRNGWKGFVQLYLTENRCTMHMEGEQEGFDAKGHWLVRRNQIQIKFEDVKIDDAGGMDVRDPNKAFVPAEEIQKAFSIPVALTIQAGGKGLESPLTVIGPLVGTYSFTKDTLGR